MTDRKAEIRERLAKANSKAPFEKWKYDGYDVDPCQAHYDEEDKGKEPHEPVDCPTRECVFNCITLTGVFTEDNGEYMELHPYVATLIEQTPSDLEWALNRIDELEKENSTLFKQCGDLAKMNDCLLEFIKAKQEARDLSPEFWQDYGHLKELYGKQPQAG